MSTVVMKTVKGVRAVCVAVNGTVRYKHTLEQQQQQQQKKLHHQVSGTTTTAAAFISMPANVEELSASHKARFSPRRTRDVSSKLTQVGSLFGSGFMSGQGTQGGTFNSGTQPIDSHVDVYDSRITVSLSSVMQTNVPKPYEISGKAPVHLNMPGGQWAQDDKYISADLHDHHPMTVSSGKKPGISNDPLPPSLAGMWPSNAGSRVADVLSGGGFSRVTSARGGARLDGVDAPRVLIRFNSVVVPLPNNAAACRPSVCARRSFSHGRSFHRCSVVSARAGESVEAPMTSRQKLRRAVKEYGATVVIFHVAISLTSLGVCYLLVSSGVDMTGIIKALGINVGMVTEEGAASGVGDVSATVVGSSGEAIVDSPGEAIVQTTEEPQASDDTDINTKRAAGAATFVVAYAVHKVMAPVRIATTLTATPFIVRHLRKIGFLRPPKT